MKKTVKFTGIDCANCAAKLEKALNKIDGVVSAQLNFMAERAVFELVDDHAEETVAEIRKVARKLEPECEFKGL